ncbi:MAG: autotransporter outer membrane beta-barrel domain-containing protein [Gammaproteobacteria bacterium]
MKMDDHVTGAGESANIVLGFRISRGLFALLLMPLSTFAQNAEGPALGNVPGQTELHQVTGAAVQTICGQFIANGTNGALEADLFARCSEMVQTARAVNPDEAGEGATDSSLSITAEQLNGALQNVATEEAATTGTFATETSAGQAKNVASRLQALRGGAGGFTAGGLNINIDGIALTSESLGLGDGYGQGGDSALTGQRVGAFINGSFNTGDKDATAREDGFDFDGISLTGGVDYRFTESFVLGATVGYNSQEADFDTTVTVAGGSVEADGFSVSGYGLYYFERFYLTGLVNIGTNENDLTRRIIIPTNTTGGADRTATASTDSDQLGISVSGGIDLAPGKVTIEPFARVEYLTLDIDGYTESGAQGLDLAVNSQEVDSLVGTFGVNLANSYSRGFGIVVPHGRLEINHQFDDDSRNIVARYVNDPRNNEFVAKTDPGDENYLTLGLGASALFKGGTQAFLDYETLLGLEDITDHLLTLGIRHEF